MRRSNISKTVKVTATIMLHATLCRADT